MRKKKSMITYLLIGSLALAGMTGCQSQSSSTKEASASSADTSVITESSSDTSAAVVSAAEIDTEFTARDLEVGYEETTAVQITLNGDGVLISGTGATFADGVLTISQEGTYVLNGELSDGQVVVNAQDTDKVQIVLNGAFIHCENQAPIYIKQADKVFLTLQEGTENTLADNGADYVVADGDSNVDGVIFSKADLTINGNGSLNVTANYKHGIVSKDDLVITGGAITVTANGQGLYGKDCVKIKDGTFELNTQSDGIQSDNAEDEDRGFVYIAGGTFTINSQTDGIQAETVLRVDDAAITMTTGGGSANASTDEKGDVRMEWGKWGQTGQTSQTSDEQTEETVSAKGLKSGSELLVNGGSFMIDSSDDSMHCNGDMTISGGNFTINSGDDGVHTDDVLIIRGGSILIEKSYEGLEGNSITITGGEIDITASDDGMNAAGGSDTAVQERPGQNSFSGDSNIFVRISGGMIKVNAQGDGIDSNANLYVDGGEVYVEGPTNDGNGALDYGGTAEVTGGIMLAVGSTGMAQGFSDSSTQYSILHNLSSSVEAGTTVTLKDSDGNELISYTPEKIYQSVIITLPELKDGTYQIAAGDLTEEITVSSVVTSNGNGGMGGGPQGGRGGQQGGAGMQPPEGESMGQPPEGGNMQPPDGESMGQLPENGNIQPPERKEGEQPVQNETKSSEERSASEV